MQALISARLAASLKPRDRPFEIRDTRLKGFILRMQPSGSASFIAEYGRGRRITIGKLHTLSVAKAREKAQEYLGTAALGGDPMAERKSARAHTFRSYLDEIYGPWVVENLRWGEAALARLRYCFPDLMDRKLGEITPWLVEKWRTAELKSDRQPTGINRDLDNLKACLSRAVEWGFVEAHPIGKVRRCKVDRAPKVRYLSDQEERRLRKALDEREARMRRDRESANAWRRERGYPELPPFTGDHLRPVVILALNTGLRRGELFNLTWADVDLKRAALTVRGGGAKSGQTRHVPLNREAHATLYGWKPPAAKESAHVFGARDGRRLDNINKSWRGVMRDAGIADFRFHDLRHTFASKLVMASVDLNTVRELLGHADLSMTLRYAHLAPEHKAAAVEKL